MLGLLSEFMTHVFDYTFMIQMIAIAFSGVLVLGKLDFGMSRIKKTLQTLIVNTVILSLIMLFLEILFFGISQYEKLSIFRGLNYSVPVLLGYTFYACFFCNFQKREKITLVMILFSTAVVMMEWSAPYGIIWFAEREAGRTVLKFSADILIIIFSCIIRRFSVTKYYFTRMDALINCTESSLVAICAVLHESISVEWGWDINPSMKLYIAITFVILYVINLLTYLFSYQISRNRQMLMQSKIIEQKQSAQLEMAELTAESLQEYRAMRHDMKNQCLLMKNMLEKKQYEELNDYFEKFTGKISCQLFQFIDCGNNDISAIINLERQKAEHENVRMNVNVIVPPKLPFEDVDICSLLMNILDNAIEECLRVKKERTVNVVINTQNDQYLYLCVINPTEKKDMDCVPDKMPTSKEYSVGHGLGMGIIHRIAEKYNGHVHFHIENGNFISEVMLNMISQEEK